MKYSKTIEKVIGAMSVEYNMQVYELQRKGIDVIVLSLGEAFFKIPLEPFEKLKNWEKGYHYSSSLGVPEMRQKIAELYEREYKVKADPEKEMLVSAGSKVVIYMALKTILDAGDEAMIFEPAWVSYTEHVRLCEGVPVMVRICESVFNLEKYVTPRLKVIIINNPNNPSGKVYSKEELQALYDFAKKHDLYIISDEAYSDFVIEEPFHSMAVFDKKKERTLVVNSLSKNLGMSGWRIGYIIAKSEFIRQILKLNQHLITCPTSLIEYYLIEHLDDILRITKPQIKAVVEKREKVRKLFDEVGLQYLPGSGTFYFLVSIAGSTLNSEAFATRLLKNHHVATVPGVGYGESVDRFLRIGVGAESLERIKKGLQSIRALIEKTKIKLDTKNPKNILQFLTHEMHTVVPATLGMGDAELADEPFLDSGLIDSLQFVQLVANIERDLAMKFTAPELESEKMRTLRGITEMIFSHGKEKKLTKIK